jgi:hypothetical protein
MTFPVTVNAVINFSTGPGFAQAMILDTGQLDVNVLADAASVIVDVSNVVVNIQTQRGRNLIADQFQAGSLTLVIADQNGDFNPMNSAGPYYNLLSPMRKVSITATFGATTHPIFAGYITSYSTSIPNNVDGADLAFTTITAVDAFRLANLANITTVTGAIAGDKSGTRINQILDQIAWPTSMRDVSLDTSETTMQADPNVARTALNAMLVVGVSEYGALYVDATGSFVFKSRSECATSVSGTVTTFADNGTGIDYYNAKWILNDALVYNQADITPTGLAVQSAVDVTSVAQYFAHTYTQTNLLMQTTGDALNLARAYVASRAQTSIRCDQLTLNLYTENYTTGITAALALDFFDPVTIQTTQPGNTSITKTEQIFGVAHHITPGSWTVDFTTMEALIDSFILDSALYGILDTSVLSY